MRSVDSMVNYAMVGNVKNLKKGVQSFEDVNPYNGKNFYKLVVSFKSGLNWTTNYCKVFIANHITSPEAHARPQPAKDTANWLKIDPAPVPVPKQVTKPVSPASQSNTIAIRPHKPDTAKANCNMSLTFVTDSGGAAMTLPPKKRPSISTDNPEERVADLQKSKYVFADNVTGHIKIELPDDFITTHYAISFYDVSNKLAADIPRLMAEKVLFDRRNFRKHGTYRFVLKKDGLEMERGYVTVN